MSGLRLTAAQRRGLERQLRSTHDAGLYRRTLAVLEAADGRPVAEIARLLRTSRVAVYRCIERYDSARKPDRLVDSRGGNHPSVWTEELQAVLSDGLGRRPEHFGYQAIAWTVPLLQEHLAHCGGGRPSETSIRRQLHALGYVWKRPRYVLQPDPERDKKTADSPRDPGTSAAVGQAVRG
jgi:transposase